MSYNKKIMEAMQKVKKTTLIEEGKIEISQENFKYGLNQDATDTAIFEAYNTVCEGDKDYQKYVQAQLGDRSLKDMSSDEKKQFFKNLDKGWKAKNEAVEDEKDADEKKANDDKADDDKADDKKADDKKADDNKSKED